MLNNIDEIQLIVESNADQAMNFCKIKGHMLLIDLLINSKFIKVKENCALLLSTIFSNNEYCQNTAIENNFFELLMSQLEIINNNDIINKFKEIEFIITVLTSIIMGI